MDDPKRDEKPRFGVSCNEIQNAPVAFGDPQASCGRGFLTRCAKLPWIYAHEKTEEGTSRTQKTSGLDPTLPTQCSSLIKLRKIDLRTANVGPGGGILGPTGKVPHFNRLLTQSTKVKNKYKITGRRDLPSEGGGSYPPQQGNPRPSSPGGVAPPPDPR